MKPMARRDLFRHLREGRFTSVGSYPIFYVTCRCDVLSVDHVLANALDYGRKARCGDRDAIAAADVNWENPELYCDATGDRIESAYAEDEVAQ